MELVDRSSRCESAKRLGFDMAIRYASELVRHSKKCGEQGKDIGCEPDEAKEKDSAQLKDAKIRWIFHNPSIYMYIYISLFWRILPFGAQRSSSLSP